MKYLFIYCLVVIGLVYIYRGYLVLSKKRINMMSGVSSLTPSEKEQMCPLIGPYYIVIGILLILIPFLTNFIGKLGWYVLLTYICVGSYTISHKRNLLLKKSYKK